MPQIAVGDMTSCSKPLLILVSLLILVRFCAPVLAFSFFLDREDGALHIAMIGVVVALHIIC